MPRIYLIDASPYIFRAYYSIPHSMQSPDKQPTNAVFGYTNFLLQVLKKENPGHIAVAFDGSLTTSFRNEIYPEYKAHRGLPPPDLEAQISWCQQVTEALGMRWFVDDLYEADDIIATLCEHMVDKGFEVVIVSNDKDLAQLVNHRVVWWDFARDRWFDRSMVLKHFGVEPEQMVDFLALVGDSVDNIPGIQGIGPKTAVCLLKEFGTLEAIFENLHELNHLPLRGIGSIISRLQAGKSSAMISRQLVQLVRDVPIVNNSDDFLYHGADPDKVKALFSRLGFENIFSRITHWNKILRSL